VLTPHGIPMASMGPVYDRVHFPGMTIDFEHPVERLVQALKARFAGEAAGIDRYFESMHAARKRWKPCSLRIRCRSSCPRPDVVEGRRDPALGSGGR